ncbi:MAG: hypothetical protein IRZ28_20255 [Steroidobacteraceae bacterium]|nr:hypothetical protein [Steroidobacteraceae bacterium]
MLATMGVCSMEATIGVAWHNRYASPACTATMASPMPPRPDSRVRTPETTGCTPVRKTERAGSIRRLVHKWEWFAFVPGAPQSFAVELSPLQRVRGVAQPIGVTQDPTAGHVTLDAPVNGAEMHDWVGAALDCLSPEQRLVLELAYFMGLSCEEIAHRAPAEPAGAAGGRGFRA